MSGSPGSDLTFPHQSWHHAGCTDVVVVVVDHSQSGGCHCCRSDDCAGAGCQWSWSSLLRWWW